MSQIGLDDIYLAKIKPVLIQMQFEINMKEALNDRPSNINFLQG
jgi:hypothetical protein